MTTISSSDSLSPVPLITTSDASTVIVIAVPLEVGSVKTPDDVIVIFPVESVVYVAACVGIV